MALGIEAAKHWRIILLLGGATLVGGLVLTVLPLVITGRGAAVIDYLIIVGPFFVVMGIVLCAWALLGVWRTKNSDRPSP